MPSVHLKDLLIILAAAAIVVPLFRRLRASAVLGYLVAGTAIGPHALGLIRDTEAAEVLAQFGVVFLLFSIGLSLSLARLTALRRYVFGLGSAQVAVTGLVLWALLRLTGLTSSVALVLAGGLTLSSTAVVLQVLVERRELGTPQGRAGFAVLLLQDLAVVPLLTLVPLLRGPQASVIPALGLALLKAGIVLLLILAIGRLLLRPLLRMVTRGRDADLFTGIVLLLVLGIGWLTEQAGLSMALGAFLAGVLVAETEYRPQVEGDIQPFRGVLLALFFVTVGMDIDLMVLLHRAPLLIALVGGLLLVKSCLLFGVARVFRLGVATSAALALMLAQGGEFGFVLFSLARTSGVLPPDAAHLAVLVIGLSMAMTPLLLALSRRVAHRLEQLSPMHRSLADDASEIRDHVLIAGYGRVGRTMALLLEMRGAPYVALDLHPDTVAEARRRGLPVYYGDAGRADVLKAAGIERARLVVITVDEPESADRTIGVVRRLDPELPVIARARDLVQCRALTLEGASAVVPEVVEGSLQLGAALLRHLGTSQEEVEQLLARIRREAYDSLVRLAEPAPDTRTGPAPG